MDASAYGSTVNLAARCESLTKDTRADIILTHNTFSRLGHPEQFAINCMGETKIRGLEQVVDLYEATGYA